MQNPAWESLVDLPQQVNSPPLHHHADHDDNAHDDDGDDVLECGDKLKWKMQISSYAAGDETVK